VRKFWLRPYLIDIAKDDVFDRLVLEHFADNATIATTNHQNLLGIRMTGKGDMCYHFLIPG
jgi:hypothetical protein